MWSGGTGRQSAGSLHAVDHAGGGVSSEPRFMCLKGRGDERCGAPRLVPPQGTLGVCLGLKRLRIGCGYCSGVSSLQCGKWKCKDPVTGSAIPEFNSGLPALIFHCAIGEGVACHRIYRIYGALGSLGENLIVGSPFNDPGGLTKAWTVHIFDGETGVVLLRIPHLAELAQR
jgi:hypothetical protein